MGKVLILTESDRNDIRKMYGLLNEGEIPYPSGISKEVVDKILSISAQNKKNLKGSYLFPTQQQDIDKQFGAGTYDKFWIGGGRDVLDGKSTFPGMKPTGKPTTTQKTKIPEIPYPSGVSKEAVDKIKSISAQNKKNLQGSYLFPPQQQDIDKQFGAGTYDKFWKGGGRDVLDGRKTFVGAQTPTSTTTNTNNAELRQKNINYIYCSVRKNIITAKGSQEGVKWDRYGYFNITFYKDSEFNKVLLPLVLVMDYEAKPWWCPRWFLRFLHVFGNDKSLVRVRNRRLHDLHRKLTKGIMFWDWKTKWCGIISMCCTNICMTNIGMTCIRSIIGMCSCNITKSDITKCNIIKSNITMTNIAVCNISV